MLDKQLAQHKFIAGDEYTIADMAIWPWFGNVVLGGVYDAAEFLDAGSYKHVQRWAKEVGERPAVKRGRIVNRTNGPLNEQLHERMTPVISRRIRKISVRGKGWCSSQQAIQAG